MICDGGEITKYELEKSSVDKGDVNKTTHSKYYNEEKEHIEKETDKGTETPPENTSTTSEPCEVVQKEEPCNCVKEEKSEWHGNETFSSSFEKITKGG